jgi:hypothetical protein
MSENEIIEKINRELPEEIDGFKRRIGVFDNFSNLIYSKDGSYLGNHLTGNITRDNEKTPLEHFAKNVLYDVLGKNLEDAFHKMKEKLELNERVKNEFSKNIMFGFNPNFKQSVSGKTHFLKLFEIYLVLDLNSDSQFFCVVSINPIFDVNYILPVAIVLKKQIEDHSFIKLSGDDFDYNDFNLPRTIHMYSYDFGQQKEELRTIFKKHGWNIKIKDKYFFEKHDKLNKERIILCEGKNGKILNPIKLPNVVFTEEHNSYSIFQNAKAGKYCLRDKDYLLAEEVKRLRKIFPNYFILNYYCIENYLYHPENIEDLRISNFQKATYIDDIIKSKNECFLEIVSNFKLARNGYKELTENHIKKIQNADSILIEELKSDEFEVFYKHFDMKEMYNKKFLEKLNLNESILSGTQWFKSKIISLINS